MYVNLHKICVLVGLLSFILRSKTIQLKAEERLKRKCMKNYSSNLEVVNLAVNFSLKIINHLLPGTYFIFTTSRKNKKYYFK
jgi:hypothetical protein